ncbi:MAG TPA: alpha/beta fold hydrolase [candidate division Zixibacteria bacterium]|nr:alpha/beta fold hydrolase [candidate division Zixibacteria bacterium]
MNRKGVFYGSFTILGIIMVIICVALQISINVPLFHKEKIQFSDHYGNKVSCSYFSSTSISHNDKGIMLFHGFAEDQHSMNSYIDSFLQLGFQIFTIDFTGHGLSSGYFTLQEQVDNVTANEVLLAKEQFKKISNLTDNQIYMIGHSLGGRAILRAATLDPNICAGLVLIGSPVNLDGGYMINSVWLEELSPLNPKTNISIITGTLDDVLSSTDAIQIFEKLSGAKFNESGSSILTSQNNIIELNIINCLLHTYEVISPKSIVTAILSIYHFSQEIFPKELPQQIQNHQLYRLSTWLLIPIGLFYFVVFGIYFLDQTKLGFNEEITKNNDDDKIENSETINSSSIKLVNTKRYFSYKPLILLSSFLFGGLYAIIFFVLPFGLPTFTLIYACPIAGYGTIMLILFATGKVPGIEGKWQPNTIELKEFLDWKKPIIALLIGSVITVVFALVINFSWNNVLTPTVKIYWLVILTLVTSLGFYVKRKESELIREVHPGRYNYIFYNNLLYLSPFILVAFILLFMGISFLFIDAFHGFAIFTLVVFSGGLIHRFCKNTYFTALLQSIMLIFLVLPRSPLMSFFY